MVNLRNDVYDFENMEDLKSFFAPLFPDKLDSLIEGIKKSFKERDDVSKKLNKLQFVKKCECELNRILKKE